MGTDRNPQAKEMADESMVRNLDLQARAIWPQERALFERYRLAPDAKILDVACGTGEITRRLAGLFPHASIVGVDLETAHLERARRACAALPNPPSFATGDAFELAFPDRSFDLVVNRHMLQAVPDAPRVLAELVRVTRAGGTLHVLAEDYAMMHFHPTRLDADDFWRLGPITYAANAGTDLRGGRKVYTWMRERGLVDVRVDYVTVDTVRVERDLFARIWEAWRDGYTDTIAARTTLARDRVWDHWNDMIAAIRDPHGYAVWQVPVASGTVAR